MALTFSQRSNLKVGQRILVEQFTGTVNVLARALAADVDGAVRIRDSNGENTHYVSPEVMTKAAPYKNDLVYRDADGSLFRYLTDDDLAPGTWQPYSLSLAVQSLDRFPYNYPVRPLREFTLNPVIAE